MIDINSLDSKLVFVVYTNTDLTEGRGAQTPIHTCWSRATARRLAKGVGVMGGDGDIREHAAYCIKDRWYAPCKIIGPTKEDEQQDKAEMVKAKAVEKAKSAGLSDEDIAALRS